MIDEDDDNVESEPGDHIQVPYNQRNKNRWSTPKEGIAMMKSFTLKSNLTPQQETNNKAHDAALAKARQTKDD